MVKISPIKERILKYIEFKGIAKTDFCEKTGISYANMKGKSLLSEIGGSQIGVILSTYREISADWLLTGSGAMLLKGNKDSEPLDHSNCPICAEKERTIQILNERIQELKETISILRSDCSSKRHSA